MSDRRPFRKYPNEVLVETGSWMGDGIQDALESGFKRVISYEIVPSLHTRCVGRFAGDPRVELLLKPSENMFDELQSISVPITFWLDGHFSHGETSFKDVWCPLLRELDAIARHPIKTHTILIDDRRCFGTEAFQGLTEAEVLRRIRAINPAYEIRFEPGFEESDVLVACGV